ncbi:Ig-like domain-containing protein [Leptospira interrogans]|uniref:Ig-like domain-containing protein n=1 Tax=Leptospira interrogans TaxID=173 RepID=UPI00077400DA|nr:Ig-like domain-containing protein [Leptospira interrogans]
MLEPFLVISYIKTFISFSILIFGGIGCVQGKGNSMPFFAYLDFSNRSADSSFNVSQISPGPNVTGVSLNTSIQVGFSQKLDSSSIQSQSIQLTQGNTIIPGNFTSTEKTLLFNPTSSLAASTVYSVSISKDIKSMDGSSLSEDYTWSFTTNTIVDLVAPDVSLRTPTIGANLVPNNTSVQIAFTETMNCTSINITNFTLKNNVTNVLEPSNVVCLGSVATLTPNNPLAFNTVYRVDILSTAKDLANNPLVNAYNWTFTTGVAPDLTVPTVSFVNPTPNAQNVPINETISIAFSEPINCATIIGSIVLDDNILIPGSVNGNPGCTGTTASFTPLGNLTPNTNYTVTVSNAITDLQNNPLTPSTWSFTTAAAVDQTQPTVTFTVPSANANGVGTNVNPMVVFSEPMSCASVTSASFRLKRQATGVYLIGSVNCFGTSATWTPDPVNPLAFNTTYTVEIDQGALDTFNNPLIPINWNFTTGPGPDLTPPSVAVVTPANAAIGVPTNGGVSIAFSEAMNCGSILGGITLDDDPTTPGTVIPININCNGNTVSFAPTIPPLAFNTTYTVTILNTVTDSNNNALNGGNYAWSFTTGVAPDLVPPQVSLVSPLSGAVGVATNANITVAFNETINCSTLNFTVNNGINGTVNCSGSSATFIPSALTPLNAGTNYTATILTVNDIVGNPIGAAFGWSFTTGAAPDVTPPVVTIQNLRNNSIVETGFVIGTATDAGTITSVEVSLDNGAFVPATGTNPWKFKLPSDINTWKQNSQHTIIARAKDLANNLTTTAAISVRKGNNKDINGDGYVDLVSAEYGQGLLYIFHSSGNAGMTITNAQSASKIIVGVAAEEFGRTVSMGDLNGDGFADVISGAPGWNGAQGKVYIFHSSGNAGVNISFSGFATKTISGANAGARFGDSIVTGDLNGDGYADLASGEPVFNVSQGRVYVFHSAGAAGVTQINSAAANSTLTGENATDRFGYSLSTGNMNGDNFADLAIGAPGYGAGVGGGFVVNQGKVYIHHGAVGGLGGVITTLTNDSAGNAGEFGISLFAADFNGDGNSDLAIGSPGLGGGFGRVSVFTSAGAGINTSTIGNAPLMINGTGGGNAFGVSLTAQDLNLDGRPDLISATIVPNRVFVFHMPGAGAIGGFINTGNATTQITSAFAGIGVSANASKTPISGGDINGDGFPDLFVGGSSDNIFIFHSSTAGTGLLTNTTATAAGAITNSGLANGFFGCSAY